MATTMQRAKVEAVTHSSGCWCPNRDCFNGHYENSPEEENLGPVDANVAERKALSSNRTAKTLALFTPTTSYLLKNECFQPAGVECVPPPTPTMMIFDDLTVGETLK